MSVPIGKSLNQLISPVSRIWLVTVVFGLRTEDTVPELGMLNEGRTLQAVSKEAAGIDPILPRWLFGGGILRRLPWRVSLAKPTFAALRF